MSNVFFYLAKAGAGPGPSIWVGPSATAGSEGGRPLNPPRIPGPQGRRTLHPPPHPGPGRVLRSPVRAGMGKRHDSNPRRVGGAAPPPHLGFRNHPSKGGGVIFWRNNPSNWGFLTLTSLPLAVLYSGGRDKWQRDPLRVLVGRGASRHAPQAHEQGERLPHSIPRHSLG